MKRATGPGKVEERPQASTPLEFTFSWRLFNFDVEDSILKPEHRKFLEEQLFFLVLDGTFISLRGETSVTGNQAFNQKLSDERVENVRKFIVENLGFSQIDARRIQGKGVGERDAQRAHSTTEDERFRSVIVTLHVPRSNKLPHFDRRFPAAGITSDGFDNHNLFEAPWQLVRPEIGFKDVSLQFGKGLLLRSTDPRIVQVVDPLTEKPLLNAKSAPQIIRLKAGPHHGDAEIHAFDSTKFVWAKLRVSVLPKLTVGVAFHYIQNPDKTSGVAAQRPRGKEKAFIDAMDSIYLVQTNIVFKQIAGANEVKVPERIGREVNQVDKDFREWNKIVKHRNRGARFNVFFVREIEIDAEGTTDSDGDVTDTAEALTSVGGVDCLFEDDCDQEGKSMAHEAGHALGIFHEKPIVSTKEMLMFPTTDGGDFIPARACSQDAEPGEHDLAVISEIDSVSRPPALC